MSERITDYSFDCVYYYDDINQNFNSIIGV